MFDCHLAVYQTIAWPLHVCAQGRTHPLDVTSVLQPPNRRYYSFLSCVFGMWGNMDIGTEANRWAMKRRNGADVGANMWVGWKRARFAVSQCMATLPQLSVLGM